MREVLCDICGQRLHPFLIRDDPTVRRHPLCGPATVEPEPEGKQGSFDDEPVENNQ